MSNDKQNEAVALIVSMIRDGDLDGREDELYDAVKRRRKALDREKRLLFHHEDRVAFDHDVRPLHLRGAKGTVELIDRFGRRVSGNRIPVRVDNDSRSNYAGSIVRAFPSSLVKIDE